MITNLAGLLEEEYAKIFLAGFVRKLFETYCCAESGRACTLFSDQFHKDEGYFGLTAADYANIHLIALAILQPGSKESSTSANLLRGVVDNALL
jgi:hypothetical protein